MTARPRLQFYRRSFIIQDQYFLSRLKFARGGETKREIKDCVEWGDQVIKDREEGDLNSLSRWLDRQRYFFIKISSSIVDFLNNFSTMTKSKEEDLISSFRNCKFT